MSRATEIWGAASTVSPTACILTDSTGSLATCNGNGNGFIHSALTCITQSEQWCYGERHRAWQHLANAGLIDGSYTGRTTSTSAAISGSAHIRGVNAPKASMDFGAYQLGFTPQTTGDANLFDMTEATNLFFLVSHQAGPAFTPATFFKIDNKIDDGRAGTGNIFSVKSTSVLQNGCTTTNDASTALYSVLNNQPICSILYFKLR